MRGRHQHEKSGHKDQDDDQAICHCRQIQIVREA